MSKPYPQSKLVRDMEEQSDDENHFIKQSSSTTKNGSRSQSVPPKARNHHGAKPSTAGKEAGAVDEDQFRSAFRDHPQVSFSSGNELEQELMKINTILSSTNEDWEKRVEQLRRLRGFIVAGAANYKEFQNAMRYVDLALQVSVKDLRSQVVREACITLSFLAEKLEMRSERTAEMNLPFLIQLIPNSVKVMATSGVVAIRMILSYVHSQKLVPIITQQCVSSKSKEIRRACCEFITIFLSKFPKSALDRHVAGIQEAIKKGMADADSEARSMSRQAYFAFAGHFPAQANSVYKELDPTKQRLLDEGMSRSTSQSSVKSGTASASSIPTTKSRQMLKTPTSDNLGVACALKIGQDEVESSSRFDGKGGLRSSSAIDMAAARRAKARAALPTSTARAMRPPTTRTAAPPSVSRGRTQPSPNVSISQPGSRSTSPSNPRYGPSSYLKRTPIAGSSISRDASPSRSGAGKRCGVHGTFPRSGANVSHGPSDDESETSSIASEHSLHSHGRSHGAAAANLRDEVPDILAQLGSGNWTTKRDGLLAFQRHVVRGGKALSQHELETVCSLFTRMMNDPTTKVIGLFLDTLFAFVQAYKLELGSWSYMLITKLLSKQGTELVPTVQEKIDKLFGLIRTSFPAESQFQHLVRFITDSTQTPNVRVKAAILNYFVTLVQDNMRACDLKNSSLSRLGITKIINWTMDGKTPEIRKNSQQLLWQLNKLNEEEFNTMVDTLDDYLHGAAVKLVNGYPHRRPSALLEDLPRSPTMPFKQSSTPDKSVTSSGSRQIRSRYSPMVAPVSSPSQLSSGNEENLNPEAVFSSLRQTAQEIQKFGYASNGTNSLSGSAERRTSTTPIRQAPASPASVIGNSAGAPTNEENSVVPIYAAAVEQSLYLSTLGERIAKTPREKQHHLLRHLYAYLSLITDDVWEEHFMTVLPVLYEQFQTSQGDLTAWSLACFAQLLKLQPDRMRQYPELTIVNILEVQKGVSKMVIKAAEDCAYLAAGTFPCDVIVKILVPIINNQPHPENAAAVRMFGFVVQQAPRDDVAAVLPAIVPSLVAAYADNEESNMRKECVYGLIYTQLKVGEQLMTPYLQVLPASKMRLMNLYLKRIVTHGGSTDPDATGDTSLSNVSADASV